LSNTSGITPTEFKVLIDPKPVEKKIGSIIIPESTQESEEYAQIEGRIVAVSPLAFSYASKEEWEAAGAEKPKPGDVVLYAKYAGVRVKGKDGNRYIIANDKDVCALIKE
jgi:co-chaperonin GroES (HSP10)